MELTKAMQRYFKKKLHKGKNTAAQIIDLLMGALLGFIVLFCFLWSLRLGIQLSAVFALCIVAAFCVLRHAWGSYQFEHFINKEIKRIQEMTMLEQLTMLSETEFMNTCFAIFEEAYGIGYHKIQGGLYYPKEKRFCYAFQNHPDNPVGVQQLLVLYRKLKKLEVESATALSAAPYAEEAQAMSYRVGIPFDLLTQDTFLAKESAYIKRPSTVKISAAIEAEMHSAKSRPTARNVFFTPKKTRAYLLCAGFLLCWYFITKFSVLYPIAAGICLVLAFISNSSQKHASTKAKAQYQ